MTARILIGDVREKLAELPAGSVHCVVTSPPYWSLRDFGVAGQLGLEPTLAEHIESMVGVFSEVWRVLRKDGTLWLNYGDGYTSGNRGRRTADKKNPAQFTGVRPDTPDGLKPKDLCMVPARLAIALQDWGWWLRSDIIWAKPNPMPSSVRDRPTSAHEHVFLLSKAARYFYDAEAVRENTDTGKSLSKKPDGWDTGPGAHGTVHRSGRGRGAASAIRSGHNLRDVWAISTEPYAEAHFATFPTKLVEPCILAGTSAKGCCASCGAPWMRRDVNRTAMVIARSEQTHPLGRTRSSGTMIEPPRAETTGWSPSCDCNADTTPCVVMDPFAGSGTTLMVAERLGRDSLGIELNPDYAALAQARIRAGLWRVEGDAGDISNIGPLFEGCAL